MDDVILITLLVFLESLLGAWFIKDAVTYFEEGKYYKFGVNIFGALCITAWIFRAILLW